MGNHDLIAILRAQRLHIDAHKALPPREQLIFIINRCYDLEMEKLSSRLVGRNLGDRDEEEIYETMQLIADFIHDNAHVQHFVMQRNIYDPPVFEDDLVAPGTDLLQDSKVASSTFIESLSNDYAELSPVEDRDKDSDDWTSDDEEIHDNKLKSFSEDDASSSNLVSEEYSTNERRRMSPSPSSIIVSVPMECPIYLSDVDSSSSEVPEIINV
jgi:hypothetical protein